MPSTPVHPRNAASLVIYRPAGSTFEILMGRRPQKAAFIPDAFVFPGGRVDASDRRIAISRPLPKQAQQQLKTHGAANRTMGQTLATTALRETYEETGLFLGPDAQDGPLPFLPDQAGMYFLGRAITPSESPIRFHARFFIVNGENIRGALRSNGELSDLDWHPIDEALKLPIIDVTEFMLTEAKRRLERDQAAQTPTPFFGYHGGRPKIRYM